MKNRVFIFLLVGSAVLAMAGCQSRYKQEKGSNEQAKIIKQSITNKNVSIVGSYRAVTFACNSFPSSSSSLNCG